MIHLVLGGARSGKSEVAERLAERLAQPAVDAPITYVATGSATDADMAERIAAHRRRRPGHWVTAEASAEEVPAAVAAAAPGVVLVDSLGTWVAASVDFTVDVDALCAAAAGRSEPVVMVSDEVGLGVHPQTEVGRQFRDRLGEVNGLVAAAATEVLLVVAGRIVRLDPVDL